MRSFERIDHQLLVREYLEELLYTNIANIDSSSNLFSSIDSAICEEQLLCIIVDFLRGLTRAYEDGTHELHFAEKRYYAFIELLNSRIEELKNESRKQQRSGALHH